MLTYLVRESIPFVFVAALGVAGISGCGAGNQLSGLDGMVTIDGKPAAGAVISFQAVAGSSGNSAGAEVDQQGNYSIAAQQGLKPGAYDVTIQYWQETGKMYVDPCTGAAEPMKSPVQYAEQGKLTVQIKAGENGQFDFALNSVKK
ncbi:MAG: carboxypeptidase-like regulatory domain-containing protein [Blastopirellula sp. JB062]